jgi:glycogen debranching enzyme
VSLLWGREVWGDLPRAETREWLCANGIGGFASGTVPGVLTRRYHGLLVAALKPPLGRTLLVAKVDEQIEYAGLTRPLSVNRWSDDTVDPSGHLELEAFRLDGTTPVWTYACADALLEKRIFMELGANTTYVQYRLLRAEGPATLEIKALVNYRDYHATTRGDGWQMRVEPVAHGLRVVSFDGARPFVLLPTSGSRPPSRAGAACGRGGGRDRRCPSGGDQRRDGCAGYARGATPRHAHDCRARLASHPGRARR